MIVTDLDKTLLHNDKSISEYTKSILNMCNEKGILISFATARPERATKHLQIGIPVSYVIANNGATIISKEKCIRNITISENTKYNLITQLIEESRITNITVEVGEFLYTNDKDHKFWSSDADWNPFITDFSIPLKEEVSKISVECSNQDIISEIVLNYPELYLLPNNGENWYQIMHRDSSKMNAITFLSELIGFSICDIIAFGDDYNDIEMLKKCGIGIAVENAINEVKQASDFVCDTNNNDGVAKYIEQHIGAYHDNTRLFII